MSLLYVVGFGLKLGHLVLVLCCWVVSVVYLNRLFCSEIKGTRVGFQGGFGKMGLKWWEKISGSGSRTYQHCYQYIGSKGVKRQMWWNLYRAWIVFWIGVSVFIYFYMSFQDAEKRKETLASMCDERARMLQDQFNVSMNHIQAMSILISTFHHSKNPSTIDQRTFARYTDRTAFERPLTSGVAYAVRVLQSEREQFEKQQGWTIKRMDTVEQNPVHKDDYAPEKLEPSPIQEEYAPVIFAQDTVSHVISVDVLSGKEDRGNVLRARESGKAVLTAPFRLLKTNRLGVILTFAVYKKDLPSNATPNERIQATDGYLGGVFHVESLVDKLLQQLASKQTVNVDVYDTTNHTHPIAMYGSNVSRDAFYHVSSLNFGDPFRKHEMHCRFKQKPPWPLLAIAASIGAFLIPLLIGQISYATVIQIAKVEEDYRQMMELKERAEAADVAKSQFLATVSHEIRTPMNGVLGMLHMLMDTDLDVTQQEYVRTAQDSGKSLVSLINEVLDQAKIEFGKLELEAVLFDVRAILDDVLSLFSEKSQAKGLELAVFVSDQVPELLIGDPGRFRQIITNLMGNSIKFTDKGHVFVTIHLVEEVVHSVEVDKEPNSDKNTLSGFPVADIRKSWEGFKAFSQEGPLGSFSSSSSDFINLIVSVEDTGEGIPLEAQSRIFTPFMQVNPSISRKHGGTGIGLSISKCLVGLMNGEIGFVSTPKIGSTFTFTAVFTNGLPSSNECKIQQISNQPQPASSAFEGMTALVIDPRTVRAKVSRYHIQRLGIHVEIVSDLNQGLSTIGNGSIVTNMVLIEEAVWDRDSGMSSHFVKNTRKVDNGVPPKLFILVNSSNSSKASSVASDVHYPTVITKPLRASMLAVTLQRAMGVRNKSTPPNRELQSLSLRQLLLGRKILIVDDNSVNRAVAAGALKKYGAAVVCVSSGQDAISSLTPPHQQQRNARFSSSSSLFAMASQPEMEHPKKAFGWAARDSSGVLSPFKFSRRETGEKDVTFKVLYCGICHSDLHMIKNEWGSSVYPLVPGHEIAGVVTEVGSKVQKFKVGDRVGVGCMVNSCRSCQSCADNLENYCPKMILTYAAKNVDGTITYGGYSDLMVSDEDFVIRIPDNLPLEAAAPLLCAGITVYSPLKYYGLDKPGLHVGVVGLGGLGHMAVKFAKALGAKVTVISTSPNKKTEAIEKLGADSFVVSREQDQMKAVMGTFDGIIDTVSAVHPLLPLISLLKPHGKLVMVGAPEKPLEVPVFSLLGGRKTIAGSMIGGIKETQEMIDFAAKHDVKPEIEVIPMDYVNTAMERLLKADVKYRFVIDIGNTLKASSSI